jgi:hypothetical protein
VLSGNGQIEGSSTLRRRRSSGEDESVLARVRGPASEENHGAARNSELDVGTGNPISLILRCS